MSALFRSPAVLGVAAVLALGAAQRVWNIIHYPVFMGFDAKGNWEYVALLLRSWELPAPDTGWSTAHPPLFYAVGAALGRLQRAPDAESVGPALALLSAAVGLGAAAVTAWLVRRRLGGSVRRTVLAAALLVFWPVHVAMSTMLSEELLTSALVTFALAALAAEAARPEERRGVRGPALAGALAGLAGWRCSPRRLAAARAARSAPRSPSASRRRSPAAGSTRRTSCATATSIRTGSRRTR